MDFWSNFRSRIINAVSTIMKLFISQIILLLLLLLCCSANSQTPVYKNYTVNDGLPSQVVYCALQDHQGYMWFGTDAGVSRFDGKHFQNFTSKDGLSDNEVLNMFIDSKGRIWFYTLNGKLSYFLNGKFHNPSNDLILAAIATKYEFMSFLEDMDGNIWLGAYGRQLILITTDNVIRTFNLNNQDSSYRRAWLYIYQRNSQEVWIITYNAVWKYQDDKLSIIDSVDFFQPMKTNFNLFTSVDRSYYYSQDGILSVDSGVPHLLIRKNEINEYQEINGLFVDPRQNIWIYTKQFKTIFYKKNGMSYDLPRTLFRGIEIGKIFIDNEGNKWFCSTGSGLYLQKSGQFENGDEFITMYPETDQISTMAFDHNGYLWFGSAIGKLNCLKNGNLSSFILPGVNKVTSIIFDADSNLWCTVNNGVRLIKKTGLINPTKNFDIVQFEYEPGKFGSFFGSKKVAIDNANSLYISRNSGLTRVMEKWDTYYLTYWTPSSLFTKRIYCMHFDYQNNLWFDNFEELHCYTNTGRLLNFSDLNSEFLSQINDIKGNLDSSLVIATYGRGVKIFKNGKIINHLTMADGLAGDLCRKVYVDSNIIYVATNQGFTYFNYDNNHISGIKTITTYDGIVSNDIKDICAKGNKIYLATSAGLCIVNKEIAQLSSIPPPVYITSIATLGGITTDLQHMKFLHNTDFNVNYIAITFVQPEKISYQYKVTGIDKQWIESKNASISFSTLSPGDYTFLLRAKKYNSDWSQPVFFQFTIIPAIWQQWWFRIYWLYFFSTIIYYAVKLYSKRNYQEQLHTLVEEQVLADERNRIAADMHDDLGADLSNLLLMTRIVDQEASVNFRDKTDMIKFEDFAAGLSSKVDEIIWALNSKNDSLEGLIHFISDYATNLSKISGISTVFNFPELIPGINISAAFRRNIFLVAKETLNNIIRHASATQIVIDVKIDPRNINILISENGAGFNVKEISDAGDGIINMHKRMRAIGGDFQITSSPGNGSNASINAPFN